MAAIINFHAKIYANTEEMTREQWLAHRRNGIGGSDIAAICGLSKWRTPMHVYLEKLDEAPEDQQSEAAEWGTRLEPLIADKFAENHSEWAVTEKKVIYSHPEHQWALANLDRMIICPYRGRGILEIKTAIPPVDGSEASTKLLNRLYPQAAASTPLHLEEVASIEAYFEHKRTLKALEESIAEIENRFKSLLGDYEMGWVGNFKVKWENRSRTGVDNKLLKELYPDIYQACLKSTQFRQFSIKKEAGKNGS